MTSLPLRECGLKHEMVLIVNILVDVTPPAGVWIETKGSSSNPIYTDVTPPAGVWIETNTA